MKTLNELPKDLDYNRTCVLVITCNKFKQVWNPFFTLFRKYWPDCPYKVIMATDFGSYNGIETIELKRDLGWANNAIEFLNRLDYDRIILFLEDFLPCEKFNNESIERLVQHSFDEKIGCLRLAPCPGPTAPWEKCSDLGILQKNDPYLLSLQTAIWDKKLLLELLIPNENPWQVEVLGSERARKRNEPFVSVKRGESPAPYIITAIVKGTWIEDALNLLKIEGIPMNDITKVIR